ncbi:WAS/WASL-interacting protein family member 2 [Pleuronectes platessa]|uniref:WAS/WASL-interacting protein family member 2 n=1 Tax=Pleuronectes platessa TaxID=8262 RepID=UPI00232A09B6|nr:WAS/WASL-interacting protein family member 2 [Pleuronectes platessa]
MVPAHGTKGNMAAARRANRGTGCPFLPLPPPPPGPPPPPTFHEANTTAPKLSSSGAKGRGALLTDICKGAKLKKVGVVSDRSAPVIEKSGGSGGGGGGGGGGAPMGMGGLFQGGVPKLRPVGDGSAGGSVGRSALRPPGARSAAPRPPAGRSSSPSPPNKPSPPEHQRSHRPSLPDISRPASSGSSTGGGMKHSTSAPPPPPPFNRVGRGNAPPTPNQKAPSSSSHSREKPLPPTPNRGPTPPSSVKPPSSSRPPTGGSSAPPPPPPYRPHTSVSNGPSHVDGGGAPELPQRHNSLHKKHTSGGGNQGRSHAPPPPPSPSPSSQPVPRPPPPAREPPGRRAAPQVPPSGSRNGGRDAPPPPPPYRVNSSAISESLNRVGKPPPPSSSSSSISSSTSSRTPAGPPPPPPPIRNGHSNFSSSKSIIDDFESKFNFHPMEELPPPEEYRHFNKVYPSRNNKGMMRGAPPAPPVGR